MLKVGALLSGLWLGGCSVFGIRGGVEEPRFSVIDRVGAVEVRQYSARFAAETIVAGEEVAARGEGFRRLAGYIFGGNHARQKVEMTAPVAQQRPPGESIVMTAPVGQSSGSAGTWVVRFYMPGNLSLATLPEPNDAAVHLVEVPGETYAVLRFAGVASPGIVRRREEELRGVLAGSVWEPGRGGEVAWFYDPPWTLPPLRRNEVAIDVARR